MGERYSWLPLMMPWAILLSAIVDEIHDVSCSRTTRPTMFRLFARERRRCQNLRSSRTAISGRGCSQLLATHRDVRHVLLQLKVKHIEMFVQPKELLAQMNC